MTTNGAPNDLLGKFNPLVIIVTVPILSHFFYPALRKYNIHFGPISRITFGFTLAMISGIIGAIVQWRVYETNPCGYHATTCAEDGIVSPLSIWLQIPNVALGALSECFCNVTAYEIAYARSPKSMKSLVVAVFLFMTALSSALGEILTPVITDVSFLRLVNFLGNVTNIPLVALPHLGVGRPGHCALRADHHLLFPVQAH